MDQEPVDRTATLVRKIQLALDGSGFLLRYQPILDLKSPESHIFNLILRMRGTDGQLLPYSSLRALAGTAHLELKIDRWLATRALRDLKLMRKSQSSSLMFVPQTIAALRDHGYPKWLARQFEINETTGSGLVLSFRLSEISKDIKAAYRNIRELHEIGIQTSLNHFSEKPAAFKVLKLLGSSYIEVNPKLLKANKRMINLIIDCAHDLNVKILLSEVNKEDSIDLNWSAGADLLQGNYIKPPLENMNFNFPRVIV